MKLSPIRKTRFSVLAILIVAVFAGFLVYPVIFDNGANWLSSKIGVNLPNYWKLPFHLGLDLQGGTHLVYKADVSNIDYKDRDDAIEGVRDVIERRVNTIGVSEPLVQTSGSGDDWRVVVELAGVNDVNQAIAMIGETPLLEFKEGGVQIPLTAEEQIELDKENEEKKQKAEQVLQEVLNSPISEFANLATTYSEDLGTVPNGGDLGWAGLGQFVPAFEKALFEDLAVGEITPELIKSIYGYHIIYKEDERGEGENKEVKSSHILFKLKTAEEINPSQEWKNTKLSGKQLDKAFVDFDPNSGVPNISLEFNNEGKDLFADITKRNINKIVGIFLDGQPISLPRVNDEITGGRAVITGSFTLQEAKLLAQRLNAGALPVPIELISQQTVGASLGQDSVQRSLFAGLIGLLAVAIYMILYYRLPGLLAVVALLIYGILVLAIFKIISVTLSLAGIAGFILSIGMAVDANVLIFERMKEELRSGRSLSGAVDEGFRRAWTSIRDGNISTLITCAILFWFTTSLVKGFALTLSIGILVSMFTAITLTRGMLKAITRGRVEKWNFVFNRKKTNNTDVQ